MQDETTRSRRDRDDSRRERRDRDEDPQTRAAQSQQETNSETNKQNKVDKVLSGKNISDEIIIRFVDASTDKVVGRIRNGDDLPRDLLEKGKYTLVAEAADPAFASQIGSVQLTLGNVTQTENVAPYALFGDKNGDFNGGLKLGSGDHTLRVEVFSGKDGSGRKLTTQQTEFEITGNGSGGGNPAPKPDTKPADPKPADPKPDAKPADPKPDSSADAGVYQGKGGRIVMEAENAKSSGLWKKKSIDGETTMLWDAAQSSYTKVPKKQELSFQFETDESGVHYIGLHSARDKGVMGRSELFKDGEARNDTGNDVYVRITEVDTGKTVLQPVKLFTYLGGSNKDLAWGDTFDKNHKKTDAKIDLKAGTKYELDIIGRSDGYALDKVTVNRGEVLKDANASESKMGSSKSAGEGASARKNIEENIDTFSIATEKDFDGVRLWVSQDVGKADIDNPASTAALLLGAKNIADSQDGMVLEGAFVGDNRAFTNKTPLDAVEDAFERAGNRYDIDTYSPRTDVDVGGNAGQFRKAMSKSLDTAYSKGEQVIIVAGGPAEEAIDVVRDWVKSGSLAQQVKKAIWALEGGFTQVTHGDTYRDNGKLDGSRDPSVPAHNISDDGRAFHVAMEFEKLYEELFDVAQKGVGPLFNRSKFDKIEDGFVEDSLLFVLEDQNKNSAVVGPENRIAATIEDDLARSYAKEFDKNGKIDVSDVGMLGVLLGDGKSEFDAGDMATYLTNDFMM